ncbi:MAG: type 1 glutamine amidotransferase domain-containing protein [Bryobacteraceae bacterium]
MSEKLKGKRVAILATDGVEQVELIEPQKALKEAGATTDVISPKDGKIKGWNHTEWGQEIPVDVSLKSADQNNYDALLLPGGVMNPDYLRMEPSAVQFVKAFFDSGKPVGAICHGPWLLIEADVIRGRKLTSWPSLRTDIRNAGGEWSDQEVVTDHGLVTSRKPADIPAFNKKIIEEFAEGKHTPQQAYASAR